MKNNKESGYVELLIGALVTALLVSFLFVKWWNMPSQTTQTEDTLQPVTASGTVPVNQLERYQADVDAAKGVQDKVEIDTAKLNQMLQQ